MSPPAPPSAAVDLAADLEGASDERLLRVIALIDAMPERGQVDRMLPSLRQRLARLRPRRPLTLRRLLVLPFEDLLEPAGGTPQPSQRRISRDVLQPVFQIALDNLEPALRAELEAAAAERHADEPDAVMALGRRLWPSAARLIAARLRSGAADLAGSPAEHRLAGQLAGAQAILAVAAELTPLLRELPPRPTPQPNARAMRALAAVASAARAQGPEALLWTLELLLARAATTAWVVRLAAMPEAGVPPAERPGVIQQLARCRLVHLSDAAARIGRARDEPATPELLESLAALAADIESFDERWAKGPNERTMLRDTRDLASEAVAARVVESLGREIVSRVEILADRDLLPDAEVLRLERLAHAVRRLGQLGVRLGLATGPEQLLEEFFEGYRTRILARVHGAGPAATPSGLLEQVRLVEILFGPDAAMSLYRDAHAVAGAVATAGAA